ncbi:MAG: hypothetical protein FJW31_18320 [Acidobacteria bacterium]|nr:hypothetical protein [Acidobacteriota bacterium]
MNLYPLLAELHAFADAGLCKRQRHPRLPLWIYNYSQKAQFEYSAASWPEPLRDARGLILTEDGHIAARGFRKFFNLSQLETLPAGQPEFLARVLGKVGRQPAAALSVRRRTRVRNARLVRLAASALGAPVACARAP